VNVDANGTPTAFNTWLSFDQNVSADLDVSSSNVDQVTVTLEHAFETTDHGLAEAPWQVDALRLETSNE
jgi:hypothetical protein